SSMSISLRVSICGSDIVFPFQFSCFCFWYFFALVYEPVKNAPVPIHGGYIFALTNFVKLKFVNANNFI
ncbi:MAG: hypothetical protein ACRCU5_04500, partial [Rhizobiaceae bacterium]